MQDNHMSQAFFRLAAAVPAVRPADVEYNCKSIISMLHELAEQGVELVVFPELCITGYTCGDLFHQRILLDASAAALEEIAAATKDLAIAAVVGLPRLHGNTLYNDAAIVAQGRVVAYVSKTYLPEYNEFYEKRLWKGAEEPSPLVRINGVKVGVEICEDLWAPIPPSSHLTLRGAEVIVNLSASDDIVGKYAYLKHLVTQQSKRCACAYAYTSAGFGESSTDLVFDGKAMIVENGDVMAESRRWQCEPQSVISDIDVELLRHRRMHRDTFADCCAYEHDGTAELTTPIADITLPVDASKRTKLMRAVPCSPFMPEDEALRKAYCADIVNIQAMGLMKRMLATGCKSLVIGISGGLDSTLALMVAVETFKRLGYDMKNIIGVTMPGMGTSDRTHNNATELMEHLGITALDISIKQAVMQHFADIGHDATVHDVTYENAQARERTQILMDLANRQNAMVLGTGDLSELALGWATYNGDHMSMYGINAGVPKTVVRLIVEWFVENVEDAQVSAILRDIVDTPISPELIPVDGQGNIKQKTEDLVGPYELHDFFIYYTLRYGFTPRKVYALAVAAFGEERKAEIKHWLCRFYRRFFSQQFKRSCMPDGPKVLSVSLSPRGDWRMPSDASAALWIAEAEVL